MIVSLTRGGLTRTFDEAFILERIDVQSSGCWIWTGNLSVRGTRARFNWGQSGEYAYRIAYRVFVGPIPDGLYICHHCDDGRCVNPDHLYAGTAKQNSADCHQRGRAVMPAMRGEEHPRAHPEEIVQQVRTAYADCELTKREVADLFGLSLATVDKWTKGETRGLEPIRVRTGRFEGQASCGTRAGYFAHRRRGEAQCPACLAANRIYMRAYKAARKERAA